MKKAVLFDCDGVLIDSERYYLSHTYQYMKEMVPDITLENIFPIIGTSYQKTCEILARLAHKDVNTMRQINDDYFNMHPLDYANIIKPQVMETLHVLKDMGIKMAICSATPVKELQRIMKVTGFSEYIEFFVSGDELTETKPSGQIYEFAAAKLGVTNQDCLVVEDSTIGIQAGKNARMLTIALKDAQIPNDQSKADYIIDQFEDILIYVRDFEDGRSN